jgi:hypothetical protein
LTAFSWYKRHKKCWGSPNWCLFSGPPQHYKYSVLFHGCYTWFGAYPNCTHIKIIVKKQLVGRKEKKALTGSNVRAHVFNAGLLARSQFSSGKSCDWPTQSRFSVVFLGSRANAELVPKFHVALHASHAALPVVTLKISPYTNVTLGSIIL